MSADVSNSKKRMKTSYSGSDVKKHSKRKIFIGVHLGAGEHPIKRFPDYGKICGKACNKAIKILKSGGSAGDAVVEAVKVLEDSKLLNAGSGSNLTYEGTVECDAGYMNGEGFFGGVGSVSGVPNPIMAAKALADMHKREGLFAGGRVPPNFMVGPPVKTWAASSGIPTCENDEMISDRAKRTYEKYIRELNVQSGNGSLQSEVNDTVGAVALDLNGHVASAVSSGGNWLKLPGRIGHSPLFGCGCWSSNLSQSDDHAHAVAVSISGSGEMLSRTRLALECGSKARKLGYTIPFSITTSVQEHLLNNTSLEIHKEPRYVGAIALLWDGEHGEFSWVHTTKNFVVAHLSDNYQSSLQDAQTAVKTSNPQFHFSELNPGGVPGRDFNSAGTSF